MKPGNLSLLILVAAILFSSTLFSSLSFAQSAQEETKSATLEGSIQFFPVNPAPGDQVTATVTRQIQICGASLVADGLEIDDSVPDALSITASVREIRSGQGCLTCMAIGTREAQVTLDLGALPEGTHTFKLGSYIIQEDCTPEKTTILSYDSLTKPIVVGNSSQATPDEPEKSEQEKPNQQQLEPEQPEQEQPKSRELEQIFSRPLQQFRKILTHFLSILKFGK